MPEATRLDREEAKAHAEPQKQMVAKGLPALAARRGKAALILVVQKIWHFMLEAKGLRQTPSVSYKIKKIWSKGQQPQSNQPVPLIPPPSEASGEDYFLGQIKKFPKDLEGYNKLGQFYAEQNNFEDAKNVYDYLTKHNPAQSDYWSWLGYSQLQLEQFELAVDSYGQALKLDSSHPNRYYNLALAHNGLQQWGNSAKNLRKVLELEPDNVKYMHVLADVYNRMNRAEQARDIFKRIARINSVDNAGTESETGNKPE